MAGGRAHARRKHARMARGDPPITHVFTKRAWSEADAAVYARANVEAFVADAVFDGVLFTKRAATRTRPERIVPPARMMSEVEILKRSPGRTRIVTDELGEVIAVVSYAKDDGEDCGADCGGEDCGEDSLDFVERISTKSTQARPSIQFDASRYVTHPTSFCCGSGQDFRTVGYADNADAADKERHAQWLQRFAEAEAAAVGKHVDVAHLKFASDARRTANDGKLSVDDAEALKLLTVFETENFVGATHTDANDAGWTTMEVEDAGKVSCCGGELVFPSLGESGVGLELGHRDWVAWNGKVPHGTAALYVRDPVTGRLVRATRERGASHRRKCRSTSSYVVEGIKRRVGGLNA
ncbi:hypothetical protein RI054_02g08440 [Pseudoscourfieldia marina]